MNNWTYPLGPEYMKYNIMNLYSEADVRYPNYTHTKYAQMENIWTITITIQQATLC